MMETIEAFSDFLRKTGAPNVLAIAIVILVVWLLVSGIRSGLKQKRSRGEKDEHKDGTD